MKLVERNGVVLVTRITDMGNGLFRPEVAFSKGRASDIVFGDILKGRSRALLHTELAVAAIGASQLVLNQMGNDMNLSVSSCLDFMERLLGAV